MNGHDPTLSNSVGGIERHLTCIWQYRGPGRCIVNVLALLAYDYLKVGDSMTRHCEHMGI